MEKKSKESNCFYEMKMKIPRVKEIMREVSLGINQGPLQKNELFLPSLHWVWKKQRAVEESSQPMKCENGALSNEANDLVESEKISAEEKRYDYLQSKKTAERVTQETNYQQRIDV
ncbi:hypothetical protein TKK_0015057 [Trichogramma kaykai]